MRGPAFPWQAEAPPDAFPLLQVAALANLSILWTTSKFTRHPDHAQEFEQICFPQQQGFVGMRWAQVAVVVQLVCFKHDLLVKSGRSIWDSISVSATRRERRERDPVVREFVDHSDFMIFMWKLTLPEGKF
jgi:hypothetical protein